MTMEQAYTKYLAVFPTYWDPAHAVPKSKEEFAKHYTLAVSFNKLHDSTLCKGELDPMLLYAKVQFDQFLGIPNTEAGLKSAFKWAFSARV